MSPLHWTENPPGTWTAPLPDKRSLTISEMGHALRVTLRNAAGGVVKVVSSFETLPKTKRLAARLADTTRD